MNTATIARTDSEAVAWHAFAADDVVGRLNTDTEKRLRLAEVAERQNDGERGQRRPGAQEGGRRGRHGNQGHRGHEGGAEMVLTDDSFASITAPVREGRTVYNNIEKTILFMLPTNVLRGWSIWRPSSRASPRRLRRRRSDTAYGVGFS
jgi:magnesium-transporting ATPase (P-type)